MGDLPSPTDKGLDQGLNLAVRPPLCSLLPEKDYYTGRLRSKPQHSHHFSSFFDGVSSIGEIVSVCPAQDVTQWKSHAVHRGGGAWKTRKTMNGRLAVAEPQK